MKWVDSTGMTFDVLAAFLRVHEATVRSWYGGHTRPTLELAVRIEKMSDGKVPVASWLYKPRRKPAPNGDDGDHGGDLGGAGGGPTGEGNEQAAS